MKRYIDEVFTAGHGSLYANDGRTRSDSTQKYGSGGLVQGKRYMISATWNAPRQAFDDSSDFFEGKGVDAVYFPFHKANQFLGMSGLPTFLAVDVMKRPDVPATVAAYQAHRTGCSGAPAEFDGGPRVASLDGVAGRNPGSRDEA